MIQLVGPGGAGKSTVGIAKRSPRMSSRWDRFLFRVSAKRAVRGIPGAVLLGWLVPDSTSKAFDLLDAALNLIRDVTPVRYTELRTDIAAFWLFGQPSIRGRYLPALRWCELSWEWMLEPTTTVAMISATIIHEATHARLDRLGFGYEERDRARVERICRAAQRNFGLRLQGPDRDAVVERAERNMPRDSAAYSDAASLAADLDDLRKFGVPRWVVWLVARRRRRQRSNDDRLQVSRNGSEGRSP